MIRYNILKLEEYLDVNQTIDYIRFLTYGRPRYINQKALSKPPFPSFLINARGLLEEHKRYDPLFVFHYIILAGRRNYWDYKYKGQTFLELNLYPEFNREKLTLNPLFEVNEHRLIFKFEET